MLRDRYIGEKTPDSLGDTVLTVSRGIVGNTTPLESCTTVAYSGMISFPLASTWNVDVCVTI